MPRSTVSSVPSMALTNDDRHRSSQKSKASKGTSPRIDTRLDRMDEIRLGQGSSASREAHQDKLNAQVRDVDRLFP